MWDVGNKTFDVAQTRRNQSSADRVNKPSLSPPPKQEPTPVPKKKRGVVSKTIVAALLLVVPNPMRSSSLDSAVTSTYAVSESPQSPPGPKPEISVDVDVDDESAPSWDEFMQILPELPKGEEKPVVELASAPKIVGETITVREIYITPPLLGRAVFDTVGD